MKKIMVFGDSVSFNAYDYEMVYRQNSTDCYPDIGSWSFKLRDMAISESAGFIYGADLCHPHIHAENSIFGRRAFSGVKGASFFYPARTDSITLYLQKHQFGGKYTITTDNGASSVQVDFAGTDSVYYARDWFSVTLPVDADITVHNIVFEGEGAYTVLGASCEAVDFIISGSGSKRVSFFQENYDEFIAKHDFDTLIIFMGGNDIKVTPHDEFRKNYTELLQRIKEDKKPGKIVMMTPTSMENTEEPSSDEGRYTSRKTAREYLDIIEEIASEQGAVFFDTWKVFDKYPIAVWRYDSVHMSRFGNFVLFDEIKHLI